MTRWPEPMRKELRRARIGLTRRIEDGNPGQDSSESPEGEEDRQDVTLECQRPCPITDGAGKWQGVLLIGRMRSPSIDGRDNTARPERGPLGTGGDGAADVSAHSGGGSIGGWHRSKGGANAVSDRGHGWVGLNLGGPAEGAVPNCKGCLLLEAVPWENPTYGILGRAAGNVYYGGTAHPHRNRKGGTGQASTYGCARQCPT